MINKKSVWFLTLFSLILVLSVYYITMPSELLLGNDSNYNTTPTTSIEESSILVSLRVSAEEELLKEMDNLRFILTSEESTIEDKNNAYDKMKDLNIRRGEEEKLENKIKNVYNLDSFVRVKNDQVEVVIKSNDISSDLANKIMRSIQEEYSIQKYITAKFTT